ncbi:hypothetical protein BH18ACT11_BH18ACT11_00340 [soil metagenome]
MMSAEGTLGHADGPAGMGTREGRGEEPGGPAETPSGSCVGQHREIRGSGNAPLRVLRYSLPEDAAPFQGDAASRASRLASTTSIAAPDSRVPTVGGVAS